MEGIKRKSLVGNAKEVALRAEQSVLLWWFAFMLIFQVNIVIIL